MCNQHRSGIENRLPLLRAPVFKVPSPRFPRLFAVFILGRRKANDGRANAPGKGEEDEEDGGGAVAGGISNSRNSNSNRSSNSGSTGGETPLPNSSSLPLPQLPPGSHRARGETLILTRGAAAPAPKPPLCSQPSDGGIRLSSETTSGSGSGAERYSGGLRRRGKGFSAPAAVSGEGKSDVGVGGSLDACGDDGRRGRRESAQARGEEEIELDFSRLKWALLRRRREEVRWCRRETRAFYPRLPMSSTHDTANEVRSVPHLFLVFSLRQHDILVSLPSVKPPLPPPHARPTRAYRTKTLFR